MSTRPDIFPLTPEQDAVWQSALAFDTPIAFTARDLNDLVSAVSRVQQGMLMSLWADSMAPGDGQKQAKMKALEASDKASEAIEELLQRAIVRLSEAASEREA